LSLDDPVERWLPELPNGDKITVAMLLDNTSGMGSWYGPTSPDADADFFATLQADWARSFTPEEVLAKHLERPALGQPGERFVWSDADFHGLGLLIERELGQDIATVIEERLAEPLALGDTFLTDDFRKGTLHVWTTLDGDSEGPTDIRDAPSGMAMATALWVGHGAMISSSQDMLEWGEALYSGDVIGEQTTETMLDMRSSFSPPSFIGQPDDGPVHYGLGTMGFCINQTGCSADEAQEIVGHSGAWAGTRNLLAYHRDSGTTVMVHTNTFPGTDVPQRFNLVADTLQQLGLVDEAAQ
jgi:D-alanyl-D-alanine carboxypeptidase